jgi:5-oxoprolinase (ATP-hydrolysing)
MTERSGWQFWVDRGGTFTDCLARSPGGQIASAKVLSSDDAPLVGIRKLLGLPADGAIPPSVAKMGTTIATNALLERTGREHALVITRGFADALEIGTQQRPELFEVRVTKPGVLYSRAVEIDERVSADGEVLKAPDPAEVREQLSALREAGTDNVAVVLLHGYAFPEHERLVAGIARELGFAHVSCSHEVCPEIGLTGRGDTTTVDAYLTPLLATYLAHLGESLPGSELKMMQSSGGLTEAGSFRGHNSILSGPAAGVVACARLGEWFGFEKVIGFDMGGTSTDVSRFEGRFERSYEGVTAGVRVRAPMIQINTIAAGGGSICRPTAGRLTVGPESAGSDPGPICYGLVDAEGRPKAADLTVTDVNLFLGRVLPDNFPFELRRDRVAEKIEEVRAQCAADGREMTAAAVAEGFLEIADLKMAQAVKEISVARGRDVREYVLCCFGGAGGQHACAVARHLGIDSILLHPLAGVLSAFGMGLADTVWEGSAPAGHRDLDAGALDSLEEVFAGLEAEGREAVAAQGFRAEEVRTTRKLDLRYRGTETPITVTRPEGDDYLGEFARAYQQLYGYLREARAVEVVQCRVEAAGPSEVPAPVRAGEEPQAYEPEPQKRGEAVFFGEAREVPVYSRMRLRPGARIAGPAIILESIGTVVVEPGFRALMDGHENVILERDERPSPGAEPGSPSTEVDPIALEVFNNLFMSIAEQMGGILRRTAVSTNIKERLDFSCAVFDSRGHLVANAPHIPVHLGAMGQSVRAVTESWPQMSPGDVFVSNNPYRGGTHLPDITVVTPVFDAETPSDGPVFFTASRAHHADVGGVTPGSVPSFSRRLDEEGVLLDNVRLVSAGRFEEELFEQLFTAGEHPARNLADNKADLEAQMAANNAGAGLLGELVAHYGREVVVAYMGHVRDNAARHVREALGRVPDGRHEFEDAMDDGTPIKVTVTVSGERATLDFTGTGPESEGNLNATEAVVRAAALYVFRALVAERIPLNEGCLQPITITVPPRSILNPSPGRAVVGGNVETSQRITDVLLGALKMAAASQGTMNNVTFGDEEFGYYETICGGAGAAEGYDGASGVHTHMTNTRITDPEVLEVRHPVRLKAFGLRRGSGGTGRWRGGDGAVRHFQFLKPLEVSILSQRRERAPYGLAGGGPGQSGANIRMTPDGGEQRLGGAASYHADAGEELVVLTPGGGGWGAPAPADPAAVTPGSPDG